MSALRPHGASPVYASAQRLGEVVKWVREQIAECERVEAQALASEASASGVQYHTAVTQRRTLAAVLTKLEGR